MGKYVSLSADLNTYTMPSICRVATNTNTNIPSGMNYGVMQVISDGVAFDKAQIVISRNNTMHYRGYSESRDWNPWLQNEAIVAKTLGKNGYIKYASGLIMQWGIKISGDAGSRFTITFPITYSYEPGSLIVPDGGYNSFPQITYEGINTSGITGFSKSGTSINLVHWFTIGH